MLIPVLELLVAVPPAFAIVFLAVFRTKAFTRLVTPETFRDRLWLLASAAAVTFHGLYGVLSSQQLPPFGQLLLALVGFSFFWYRLVVLVYPTGRQPTA
jgi:hypothetical protein